MNTYEDNSTTLEMFQLKAKDNDELNILIANDMPNSNTTRLAQKLRPKAPDLAISHTPQLTIRIVSVCSLLTHAE